MKHPDERRLGGYANRTLAPADLLAVDDHLAECDACRSRAAALARMTAPLADLGSELLPVESHLSDQQVVELASGGSSAVERARLLAHLRACETCAREVEELRGWARERPRMRWLAYAAAALLLLVPATVLWRSHPGPGGPPSLAGLEALSAEDQERVRAALQAGVAVPPASDPGQPEALMGGSSPESFRVVDPLATVTASDRPTFRWQPLAGAEAYRVSVSDEALRPVAKSPSLPGTAWTPEQPLPRGRSYVWQVTAQRSGASVMAPAPPAPLARFSVLDERRALLLERLAREHPGSHLLLGILYVQAGVRAEAEAQLGQVQPGALHFQTARRTLDRLRAPDAGR